MVRAKERCGYEIQGSIEGEGWVSQSLLNNSDYIAHLVSDSFHGCIVRLLLQYGHVVRFLILSHSSLLMARLQRSHSVVSECKEGEIM